MCIDFNEHQSGGSSFDMYMIFDSIISVGHTYRYKFGFEKKIR